MSGGRCPVSCAATTRAGRSIRDLAADTGRSYGFIHRVLKESGANAAGAGGANRRPRPVIPFAAVSAVRCTAYSAPGTPGKRRTGPLSLPLPRVRATTDPSAKEAPSEHAVVDGAALVSRVTAASPTSAWHPALFAGSVSMHGPYRGPSCLFLVLTVIDALLVVATPLLLLRLIDDGVNR